MASSARNYTHQTYGVGTTAVGDATYDEISKRHTAALARSMQMTKEGAMKETWKFSLNRKGLLILAARAAYMATTAVSRQREITLSVYAKVEGSTPTSMGQSVCTWGQLQERMMVPASTSRNDQEAMLTFMMGVVSAREGIDYIMQSTISTRPPLTGRQLITPTFEDDIEREQFRKDMTYGI